MSDVDRVTVQVLAAADGDLEELTDFTGRLRDELLELDVAAVEPMGVAPAPDRAKGPATFAGWLVVQFGTLDGLRAVLAAVQNWARRSSRTVEVSLGGDVLKISGATSEQQESIINAWLERHAPGT